MIVLYQTLELTLSSQSVWSAIESQVKLRQASVAGAALLLLWCLSPLGGQASLRLLHREFTTHNSSVPLRYLSSGLAMTASAFFRTSSPVYRTAVALSPVAGSKPEDSWGRYHASKALLQHLTMMDGRLYRLRSLLTIIPLFLVYLLLTDSTTETWFSV